ncbi:helix-turn-helix domain-containing protein [Larkinella bovis]|uniref:Helix-turn-helix domain-containing protein n=1 Tax=Larkinella bovis TaxID=683041 RepID=A0ABW0I607_9BACT
MELSDRIKAIREEKRIKLSEMATALGVDVSNYAKIEKKGKKLTLERLEEIAEALNVTLPELLDLSTNDDAKEQVLLIDRIEVLTKENEILRIDLKREKTEKDMYMNIVQSGLDLINTVFNREKKKEAPEVVDKLSEEDVEKIKESISNELNKIAMKKTDSL